MNTHEIDVSEITKLEAQRQQDQAARMVSEGTAIRHHSYLRSTLGVAAIIGMIGLAGFLILYGWSLLHPTEIIRETVRVEQAPQDRDDDRTVPENILADLRNENDSMKQQLAESQRKLDMFTKQKGSSEGVEADDVNFFHQRPFGDKFLVVTGWKYTKLSDAVPSSQWCYAMRNGSDDRLSLIINGRVVVSSNNSFGWSNDVIQTAMQDCQWFKGTNENIKKSPTAESVPVQPKMEMERRL